MASVIELAVNGATKRVETDPERSLLGVLRNDLDLTGAKYGCGEGECAACTVLLDGKPIRSCITAVGDCAGKQIRTIEGLSTGDKLHPLQQAFLDCGAMQCGYCTTGMIMSGVALLERSPDPQPPDIARHMNGNICRCGTYQRIVEAIQKAAAMQKGGAR
jgi:aerobic-type carbon monoxide dehydrogenase small subunit (CoxS/CutS family)